MRCSILAETSGFVSSDVMVDLACFEIRGQVYGIDVLQIREIVRAQSVTALPKAPPLIEGVIDLRGIVIPVIDLGRALGGLPVAEGSSSRIAVLEVDEMVLGLRVEAAVDVLSVAAGSVEEPPALATNAGYDAVRAVVRRKDASPVMVLSMDHLLESIYRASRPQQEVD